MQKTSDALIICRWLVPDRKEELIKFARRRLAAEFEINDLGMMHYVLGMEVWTREVCIRDPKEVQDDGLQGHDHTYGIEHEASDASSETVDSMMYHQMIGSLMYLMNTRPDIWFSMNTLSRLLIDLRHVHLIVGKHILRYLRGTVDYGLKQEVNQKINLEG